MLVPTSTHYPTKLCFEVSFVGYELDNSRSYYYTSIQHAFDIKINNFMLHKFLHFRKKYFLLVENMNKICIIDWFNEQMLHRCVDFGHHNYYQFANDTNNILYHKLVRICSSFYSRNFAGHMDVQRALRTRKYYGVITFQQTDCGSRLLCYYTILSKQTGRPRFIICTSIEARMLGDVRVLIIKHRYIYNAKSQEVHHLGSHESNKAYTLVVRTIAGSIVDVSVMLYPYTFFYFRSYNYFDCYLQPSEFDDSFPSWGIGNQ